MSTKAVSSIFTGFPHVTASVASLICEPVQTLKTAWMVGELRAATGHNWKEGTFGEASDAFFIDRLPPQAADDLVQKFNQAIGRDAFEATGPYKPGMLSLSRSDFKQVRLYERDIDDKHDLLKLLRLNAA